MSIKNVFFLLILSVTAFSITVWIKGKFQKRAVASFSDTQISPVRLAKPNNNYFEVQIQNLSGLPDDEAKEVRLRAVVRAKAAPTGNVHYSWILPPGIQLVSGETSDTWENFRPGQTAFSEISVEGLSQTSGPLVIIFHATTEMNDTKVGNSAIYSPSEQLVEAQGIFNKSRVDDKKPNYLKRRQGIQY